MDWGLSSTTLSWRPDRDGTIASGSRNISLSLPRAIGFTCPGRRNPNFNRRHPTATPDLAAAPFLFCQPSFQSGWLDFCLSCVPVNRYLSVLYYGWDLYDARPLANVPATGFDPPPTIIKGNNAGNFFGAPRIYRL